ncbi:MAG: hypothetical protein ACRDMY_02655 [Gaiellaceae bacterium]
MASINKLSEQMIDLAERLADVNEAAQGRSRKRSVRARWLVLPAAGAGLYALGTSRAFTRQAKNVVAQAKDRASDLPEELLSRVQQATGVTNSSKNGRRSTRSTSSRTSSRRKTSSAR